jgi:ribosomal-protein-alanine N-acetyltransferase
MGKDKANFFRSVVGDDAGGPPEAATRLASPALNRPIGPGISEVQGFAVVDETSPTQAGEPVILRGVQVMLRPLAPEDVDTWTALQQANVERFGPDDDLADFDTRCRSWALARSLGVAHHFGVFVDGDLVGEAGISELPLVSMGSVYVWIDQGRESYGLATESSILLCQLAFDDLGLHRLEFAVTPENERIRSLLEQYGLRDEGVAASYASVQGQWRDHVRYAITEDEWRERREGMLACVGR